MGEYKRESAAYETRGVATQSLSSLAQQNGFGHVAKSNCAICGKSLKKEEVKFVLPSKAFGSDEKQLESRIACIHCYSSMATRIRYKAIKETSKATVKHITAKKLQHTRIIARMAKATA